MRFHDRHEAGRQLAAHLEDHRSMDTAVIALPRGGVAVAEEVARVLGAPLDVIVALELGAPARPETAIGVLAEGGTVEVFEDALWKLGLSQQEVHTAARSATAELQRRVRAYRDGRDRLALQGRAVILVGDGLVDPAPVWAAARAIREQNPRRLTLAVPVARGASLEAVRSEVDETICLDAPQRLLAVGLWYEDFPPITDEDVAAMLRGAAGAPEVQRAAVAAPQS